MAGARRPQAGMGQADQSEGVVFLAQISGLSVAVSESALSERELISALEHESRFWPADEQEVFGLHYLSGFDAAEIALITGRPAEEVISRVEDRLRVFLRDTGR